ncbi:hypothetical protein Goarm_016447, partial [Gossypium armourianum]|nr:hypothetical protein [Gossypium armourianum]
AVEPQSSSPAFDNVSPISLQPSSSVYFKQFRLEETVAAELYGESQGTRRVLAWPCNDSHCRARILQAEVTKKLMNLLEDINDWM